MAFQIPELGIMALAMMVVILTGGINLSLTYVASLSGITMALVISNLYSSGADPAVSIVLGLVAGLAMVLGCGLLNGFLVAHLHVSPILATLGTMMLFEGIGLNLTEGRAISGFPESFSVIGNGTVAGIPISLIIFIVIAIVAWLVMERSPWGTKLHMLGSNETAVSYSGVNVKKQLMQVYLLSAVFCFLATLVMTARYNSMKVDYGSSYLLQSILAVVLGGASIAGGYGKVFGTVVAVFTLQIVSSGLNIFGLNRFFVDIVMGCLLIAVLALNFVYSKVQDKNMLKKIKANEA